MAIFWNANISHYYEIPKDRKFQRNFGGGEKRNLNWSLIGKNGGKQLYLQNIAE